MGAALVPCYCGKPTNSSFGSQVNDADAADAAEWAGKLSKGGDGGTTPGAVASTNSARTAWIRIPHNNGKLTDSYEVEKVGLGEGSYGSVNRCRHKNVGQGSSEPRACKAISKRRASPDLVAREVEVMRSVDHPNVVRLYETFQDHSMVYLVMEICEGGELLEAITSAESFTEVQAASVMQQVVRGVNYMHSKYVCHRDLKPENFLLQAPGPIESCTVKIIDFGLATIFQEGSMMKSRVGSPYYMSPEVLKKSYTQATDMWSLGVVMYAMLCGYPPFCGNTDAELFAEIQKRHLEFEPEDWDSVSTDGKDLVKNLINRDVGKRFSAAQTMEHTWIRDKAPKASNTRLCNHTQNKLKNFCGQNKIKKLALNVVARHLTEGDIAQLKELFVQMDDNSDGTLSMDELKKGMEKAGALGLPEDLVKVMQGIDADGNGRIDYTEFLAATMEQKSAEQESACWAAFRAFDRDGNGRITRKELQLVLETAEDSLGSAMGAEAIEKVLLECDGNGDDEIDFDEFLAMMKSNKL